MALWTLADLGSVRKAEFWAGDVSTSGSNITQANDQSGNGNHAVQATGSAQPTYSATGVNSSYPSMEFDASNDWLGFTLASGEPSQPITFIFIGEWRGGSNWANLWRDINGNGPVVYKNNTGSNFSMYGGSAEIQDSAHFTSGPVVIVAHFDGANSFLSVNGNRSSKSNAGTSGCAAPMALGGVPVSGSWFGGGINRAAVLVGQSLDASSDATLDKIEGYGAWTIGNASSLPGGHAYKSAAPTTGATTYSATLSATVTTAATRASQARAIRAAGSTAAAAVVKTAQSARAAATTAAAALIRSPRLAKAASVATGAAKAAQAACIRAAASTCSAALAAIKAKLMTLSASVTATAAVVRSARAVRAAASTVGATKVAAVSVVRAAASAVTAVKVATVRAVRAGAATCSAALATIRARLLTLSAAVTASASVVRSVRVVRSAATACAAALARMVALLRAANTIASAAVSAVKTAANFVSSAARTLLARVRQRVQRVYTTHQGDRRVTTPIAPRIDIQGVAHVTSSIDDVLDYWIDWTDVLAAEENIASSSWSVGAEMAKGSTGIVATKTFIFAGPATSVGSYVLVNTITTSQNRTYERTLMVDAVARLS